MVRSLQYLFIAIIVTTVGFSLYQWNASRASTQKTAPNNGLVGYWSFDEGTGTQAGDASGNNNTGTLTNGPTWVNGKLGQAVSFDAVDDYIDAGTSSSLMPAFPFSISTWVMDGGVITTADPANNGEYSGYILIMGAGGITAQIGDNNGYCSGARRNTYTTNATTLTAGRWYHVTAVFTNASSFSIFVNGASVTTTQSGTNGLSIGYAAGARFRIARYFAACGGTTSYSGGKVDEVRIYNRALSGTEITNLYNLGAEKLNVSPVSNLTSGLVGYWTFDGKDTPWSSSSAGTATDRSGNSNTGTLTNMSRATSSVSGKLGQALNFDGVDDYVSTVLDSNTSSFTLSTWVKSTNTANNGDRRTFLSKRGSGDEWILYQNSSTDQKIAFVGWDSGGAGTKGLTGTAALVANQWYHVTVTYDGTTATLFINGILESSTSTGNAIFNTVNYVVIGKENLRPWSGSIDEVRIYNRALSATEVQSLYDLGASDKVNSSVSQNQGTGRLDSGLVGYWKLDDASGTTATDSSTNANNGTLTNGPTWGTGRIGGDVVFDGTNDYIATTGNTPFITLQLQPHSLFAWVYPLATSATQSIISYGQSDDNDWSSALGLRGASRTATWLGNGTNENSIAISTLNVPVNQWSFVGVVLNGTAQVTFYVNGQSSTITCTACGNVVTSDPFTIGATYYAANRGGFFSGSIDEVRVYNRVLSDDEVSQLYRLTAPTAVDTSLKGYWSFNGSATNWTSSSAGTVSDLSGSANTGTLTNMSRATSSVSGKLGQGLKFDGVDDYVDLGNSASLRPTGSMSLCAWAPMYHSANPATSIISNDGNSGARGYALYEYSINGSQDAFAFSIASNSTTGIVVASTARTGSNGGVFHVCGVYDAPGQTTQIYVNGTLEGTKTSADGIPASQYNQSSQGNPKIGNRGQLNSYYFTGVLDEVRLYARALSATEITALYNSGR